MLILLPFILACLPWMAGTEKKPALVESNVVSVAGEQPATLKTFNGCWDVNRFIINRGDSVLNIPASIGHYSDGTYEHLETLPSNHLLDASFPEMSVQYSLDRSDDFRVFTITTATYIYKYVTRPGSSFEPVVSRSDSLPTPPGYITSFVFDGQELLVVNKLDSVNYAYAFYDLDFTLDTQLVMQGRPEKIMQSGGHYYVFGNEGGNTIFLQINLSTHAVDSHRVLPAAAANVKEVTYTYPAALLVLSSPGDTVTNLVRIDDSTVTSSVVLHSGIHASTTGDFRDFYVQPITDASPDSLHRQIVHMNETAVSLRHRINKRAAALHFKQSMFGSEEFMIFTEEKSGGDNEFFFRQQYAVQIDSMQAGANPSWFGEDLRCYISIEEVEKNLAIHVYPNPADEQVNIEISGLAKGKTYRLEICDAFGKLIWNRDILSKQVYSIPLNEFPSGPLLLRVNAGTKVVTKKILKM